MIIIQQRIMLRAEDSMNYMLDHSPIMPNLNHFLSEYISDLSVDDTIHYSFVIGKASRFFGVDERIHMAHYLRHATLFIINNHCEASQLVHHRKINSWCMNLMPLAHPYSYPVDVIPEQVDLHSIFSHHENNVI